MAAVVDVDGADAWLREGPAWALRREAGAMEQLHAYVDTVPTQPAAAGVELRTP